MLFRVWKSKYCKIPEKGFWNPWLNLFFLCFCLEKGNKYVQLYHLISIFKPNRQVSLAQIHCMPHDTGPPQWRQTLGVQRSVFPGWTVLKLGDMLGQCQSNVLLLSDDNRKALVQSWSCCISSSYRRMAIKVIATFNTLERQRKVYGV